MNLNEQGYLSACSIKDISATLAGAMNQKISIKNIDDKDKLLKAIESVA